MRWLAKATASVGTTGMKAFAKSVATATTRTAKLKAGAKYCFLCLHARGFFLLRCLILNSIPFSVLYGRVGFFVGQMLDPVALLTGVGLAKATASVGTTGMKAFAKSVATATTRTALDIVLYFFLLHRGIVPPRVQVLV
jgi:hypothetical protein